MLVPSLFLLFVALVSASDMACLKMQIWPNEDCSGDPDEVSTVTITTDSSEDCVPLDDPTFGQCSLNHQYCDMLANAFKQTVYVGNDTCDSSEASYVQEEVFDSGECYGGPEQSVLVECTAVACPSFTIGAIDHRALMSLVNEIAREY